MVWSVALLVVVKVLALVQVVNSRERVAFRGVSRSFLRRGSYMSVWVCVHV